jgi:RNA polymerase sigma-70 factor, ECF subfamily
MSAPDPINFLVKKYCTGDNDALAEFFRLNFASLLFTAYSILEDEEQSKDLVSEIFTKLLEYSKESRQKRFSDCSNFEGYIVVIIKNRCIDVLRQNKNRFKILSSIKHSIQTSVLNNASSNFEKESLNYYFEMLPPREKEVLTLHLEGYEHKEIAEKLGISYNSVRNNIAEAKKKLRIQLKGIIQ